MAQPATTKIGVAYSGSPKIVQGLTADHALAADALHVSLGKLARGASPYVSLRDLIKQWPTGSVRREILLISSGADEVFGDSGTDKDNIYVDSAIAEAQNAGVIVSTIATSSEGAGASRISAPGIGPSVQESGLNRVSPAKNNLSQIAEQNWGRVLLSPVRGSYFLRSLSGRLCSSAHSPVFGDLSCHAWKEGWNATSEGAD